MYCTDMLSWINNDRYCLFQRGNMIHFGSELCFLYWKVIQEHLLLDGNETTVLQFFYWSAYPILINVWVIPLSPRTRYSWHHCFYILQKINALITANEVPCLQRREKNYWFTYSLDNEGLALIPQCAFAKICCIQSKVY